MLGFLQRRVLKEHMKLVAQNYSALAYLSAFLPPDVTRTYNEVIGDMNISWRPGTKLSDEQFMTLYSMNTHLRRAFDASPAHMFGMKKFDEQFKPLLGWNEYYSRYL
jgi:hypothetical protein